VDYQFERLINAAAGHEPALDAVMVLVASFAAPAMIALVLLWLAVGWWRNDAAERRLALMAGLAASGALAVNLAISHVWYRPRPFADHPDTVSVLLRHSADSSFPSDHAAAMFAIGFLIHHRHRRLGLAVIAAAAVVGFARVFVGDHYPGDVAAGAAVGAILGIGLRRLLSSVAKRIDEPLTHLRDRIGV
jgi:undecaprenyl-diphosphatase